MLVAKQWDPLTFIGSPTHIYSSKYRLLCSAEQINDTGLEQLEGE